MIAGQRQFRSFAGAYEDHYPYSEWIPPYNPKYPYGSIVRVITHRGRLWQHVINYHNETGKSTGEFIPIVDTCDDSGIYPF